jgi:hypothetical protein
MDISQRSLEMIENRQSETLNVNVESNQASTAAPIDVMHMPLLDRIPILDSSIGNTRYTGLTIPSFESGRQSKRPNPFYEEPSRKTSINNPVDGVNPANGLLKYGEVRVSTGGVNW